MDPGEAEKNVFKRFRWRLLEVLQELYFMATKEGKIKTFKEAKKWLNEQERLDAPQVAAKRWRTIKLQHDGREIRLRDWRDFRGQYTLFRRNVEDWNEGDDQARLLSMLQEAWIKRLTKEEAKRAKFNHTFKMMLPKEYHPKVLAWTKKHVARDVKRRELLNALLITVTGDREKAAMLRLDENDVGGQTLCVQAISARMTCDEVLDWVGEEVLKVYRNLHHTRSLTALDRDINYVGEGSGGESAMHPAGTKAGEALNDEDDDHEPSETAVCVFVANNLNARSNRESWKPLQKGLKKKEKKEPRRIGDPPLSFGSPRPHRPHPGHTGRRTLAARSRGRVAGGGTAPDTRRPSQRWQATPPGDGPPPPPQHAAPTGHAGQGDSAGPPHPHTRAHSTWVSDPNSPPSGRAVGGGTAPDLRRPSQWWKAPPPGTPFRHPQSEQRRPARAHASGPGLGPHARDDRTLDKRVAERWLPAPEDGRPGEGQPLTPDAPRNGGRPTTPGTAPHHPRGTQPPQGMQAKGTVSGPHTHTSAPTVRGWRTPTPRPVGGQSGEGQRLTSDAPHNGGRHPPRGRPSATPTASNAGPQGRKRWGRGWVPKPAPTAPGTHGSRNPGCPLQRTGGRGRDSA